MYIYAGTGVFGLLVIAILMRNHFKRRNMKVETDEQPKLDFKLIATMKDEHAPHHPHKLHAPHLHRPAVDENTEKDIESQEKIDAMLEKARLAEEETKQAAEAQKFAEIQDDLETEMDTRTAEKFDGDEDMIAIPIADPNPQVLEEEGSQQSNDSQDGSQEGDTKGEDKNAAAEAAVVVEPEKIATDKSRTGSRTGSSGLISGTRSSDEAEEEAAPVPAPSTAAANFDTKISTFEEIAATKLEKSAAAGTAMLKEIRAGLADTADVIFVVHGGKNKNVVAYHPSEDVEDVIDCVKVTNYTPGAGGIEGEELEEEELNLIYDIEIVENDDRDYPTAMQMPMPAVFASETAPVGSIGKLLGAVSFPMCPDVIVDVWSTGKGGPCWATSTIGGTSFAILERLCITEQDKSGKVQAIDMFGRHPQRNLLITETYENGDGKDDESDEDNEGDEGEED